MRAKRTNWTEIPKTEESLWAEISNGHLSWVCLPIMDTGLKSSFLWEWDSTRGKRNHWSFDGHLVCHGELERRESSDTQFFLSVVCWALGQYGRLGSSAGNIQWSRLQPCSVSETVSMDGLGCSCNKYTTNFTFEMLYGCYIHNIKNSLKVIWREKSGKKMCPKKNEQYMQIHQWSWSYQTRIFIIVYKYVKGNEKVNKMDEEMKDINRKLRSIKNIMSR